MDLFTAVVLLAAMICSYLAGRYVHRTKNKTPRPICGCKHDVGMHTNGRGRCHASYTITLNTVNKVRSCECQVYSGPELVSSMTMRAISELGTARDDD